MSAGTHGCTCTLAAVLLVVTAAWLLWVLFVRRTYNNLAGVPASALPAYVISVPNTRPRSIIKNRFRGKVHNVHVFDGVDGTRLPRLPTDKLRPGEIGCAMSHMRLWRLAARTGAPAVLVFEDDADPVPDFHDRLAGIIPHIDDSIDMVFLGHCSERGDGTPYAPGLTTSVHPRCTHGYLVTRKGIQRLVKWAARARLTHPIDELLARQIYAGNIQSLTCSPPLVNATANDSLINQMGGRGVAIVPQPGK